MEATGHQGIILIKPDAIAKGLVDEILAELAHRQLQVTCTKTVQLDEPTIRAYQPILNEPSEFGEDWKQEAIAALTAGPVIILCVAGPEALRHTKEVKTTIRSRYVTGQDYQSRVVFNLIHAPDAEELNNHMTLFFPELESASTSQHTGARL